MSTSALARFGEKIASLTTLPQVSEKEIQSYAGKQFGNFLPYIQVCQSNSPAVQCGAAKYGHMVLVVDKSNYVDLGGKEANEPVLMIPCGSRTKAVDMRSPTETTVLFDASNPEFATLWEIAQRKGKNGVLVGMEFLVYLVKQQRFATLFYYNKTLRSMTQKTIDLNCKIVAFNTRYCENTDGKWYGLSIAEANIDIPDEQMPNEKAIEAAIEQFKTSTQAGVE